MRSPASHRIADFALALLLAGGLVAAGPASLRAQEQDDALDFEERGFYQSYVFGQPDEPSRAWVLSYGGRLYDQWWAVLLQEPPEGTHPSYPATGERQGEDSWRCVECHGWDYRGRDGAFGRGEHFTGIPGIGGALGADPERIVALLRDDIHRYTPEMIPEQAAMALALFVTLGQAEPGAAIDRGSDRFRGDAERGREIFQNICAICHDYDGGAWIGGEEGVGDSLGAIARGNPARALHKVMNGQTYADMPAMRPFGLPTVIDILTYVQTLEHKDQPTRGDP